MCQRLSELSAAAGRRQPAEGRQADCHSCCCRQPPAGINSNRSFATSSSAAARLPPTSSMPRLLGEGTLLVLIGEAFQTWASWAKLVPPPAPRRNNWWGLEFRPCHCRGRGRNSSGPSHGARAACWGELCAPAAPRRSSTAGCSSCWTTRRCGNALGGSANDGWGLPGEALALPR